MLSHRNMVAGAKSVAEYLGNHNDDVLLAALPLSFDAGFSQLTTAFPAGARVVLLNYLMPKDVISALAREGVTGPRVPSTIGFSAIRGGDIVGDHTVLFAGTGERI